MSSAPSEPTPDVPVELMGLLNQTRAAAQSIAAGSLQELVLRTEEDAWVCRLLEDGYLMAKRANGSPGRSRFALRVQAQNLREALR